MMIYLRHSLRSLRSNSKFFFNDCSSKNGEILLFNARIGTVANAFSLPLCSKVLGFREPNYWCFRGLHDVRYHNGNPVYKESVDPFSLVADELSNIADKLRSMVVAEVPKLASAAEYFFKVGVEGKRFRPTVLLLMASALDVPIPVPAFDGELRIAPTEVRARQQSIAEITEMIHVASLLHDDVLDDAETRRGIDSLNFVMGNKVSP